MHTEIKSHTVVIEKLVYGGDGLCRLSTGEVMLVPWTAPKDHLTVVSHNHQKGVLHGSVQQILSPSPDRVTPPCSVFGRCGGCQWQHLRYESQKRWKHHIVVESLTRIGKLPAVNVLETIGAPEPESWHYRNKVEWHVKTGSDRPRLGYTQYKSHAIVAFEHCWIIPQRFNELAHWLEQHPILLEQTQRIQARINQAGQILLAFQGSEDLYNRLEPLCQSITQAFSEITGIVLEQDAEQTCVWGAPLLTDSIQGKRFQVTSDTFFQVTPLVTGLLVDYLKTILPGHLSSLVDIYAGTGFFAIHLHDRADRILAVESSQEAIANAMVNLKLNNLNNIELRYGDAAQVLQPIEETFAGAILDPPRKGCDPAVLTWVNQHVSDQLVYISCNPTTLARDLKELCAAGWAIESVQPFDMFPQTYHIEAVASLKRHLL